MFVKLHFEKVIEYSRKMVHAFHNQLHMPLVCLYMQETELVKYMWAAES